LANVEVGKENILGIFIVHSSESGFGTKASSIAESLVELLIVMDF
jgi:hypothetical protein